MASACGEASDGAGADYGVLSALRTAASVAARGAYLVVVAIAAAILVTARPNDPKLWPPHHDDETTQAIVVTNGFHSGLILPRERLLTMAVKRGRVAVQQVATRFGAYALLEFGWGEEEFYRNTPTLLSINPVLALRALFWPFTRSVVHVVGLAKTPDEFFAGAERITIDLGDDGFGRLVDRLDVSLRRNSDGSAEEAGPGLYGPSLFYGATGHFSVVSDCNRWVGDLLGTAGLPTSPIFALVPVTFFPSLRNAMRHADRSTAS